MDDSPLLVEYTDTVAHLTFNRPEKRNAFNGTLLKAFEAAIDEVADRRDIRVVVLRGAGGAFSSGADVAPAPSAPKPPTAEGEAPKPERRFDILDDRRGIEKNLKRWMALRDLPQPVIAAVEGPCYGIATQLCIMCDITIAADNATIGWPGLPLGGGFISPMWTWLVGPSRAKYMSFRPGSTLSGKEAAEWGWATLSLPPDQFDAELTRIVTEISRVPGEVLALKKASVNRQMDVMGFAAGVKMGVEYDAILHESEVVKGMRRMIREKGLRGAMDSFRSGS
jgi:enoyl-CoA hydratase